MGYSYGIKQCCETILHLSSDQNFNERIAKAFSEIGIIHESDVSKKHFKEIKDWRNKYLSIAELLIDKKGTLQVVDKEKELRNLATEIVSLCIDIVEHNSKNSKKTEP